MSYKRSPMSWSRQKRNGLTMRHELNNSFNLLIYDLSCQLFDFSTFIFKRMNKPKCNDLFLSVLRFLNFKKLTIWHVFCHCIINFLIFCVVANLHLVCILSLSVHACLEFKYRKKKKKCLCMYTRRGKKVL